MTTEYRNYIDGRFVPHDGDMIDVHNPATHALLARVPETDNDTVDQAMEAARRAQSAWAALPAIERAGYLRRVAERVRGDAETLARIISEEQGKVMPLARIEVAFTADYIEYMAEWARRLEGEVLSSDRAGETMMLLRRPIGVVAGILPWNFPFFLIARKMAPALVTGNCIVIKPSEETPLNAYAFTHLLNEVGLPPGVFNLVGGRGATVGRRLSSSPGIDLITFTGSVATGAEIMRSAAENLTRVNLELGGKAPAIVLADADLDLAAKAIHDSRVINTGQVCNCAERVYVERPVAEALTERLAVLFRDTRYGDPATDETLHMGPLVNRQGLEKVAGMVEHACAAGAEVVAGGSVADLGQGFHYQPTVLTGCRSDMEIMREEIFGPVLPIQVVDDLDEAVALANDSDYGLTSSVFTRDLDGAFRAIRNLRFGETYVNREHFEAMQGFHAGRRKSGIGGADGKHGLYEFMETQVVYLQTR